uniref:Metal dependent phosphohydrolase n=1 Tax=uncultured bacterium contig00024 TaxID=1181513 RepID=A0A806KBV6_9BACT|nr:metal dependent phosphohydrolase [uncultured bacterium contig00024]
MKSSRELSVDHELIEKVENFNLSGIALKGLKWLLGNEEIQAAQEYANTVSIVRLGYNDHGPVHMRKVALNAIIMFDLIRKAGIKTTLENDLCGDFEDSLLAVITAAMLHDIGMGLGRQEHEIHSTTLALPFIDKLLNEVYKEDDYRKKAMIRAITLEGIRGHMGTFYVSSLEAGFIQVADGLDMTKGRARIPVSLIHNPRSGNIHQYSANSIEEVRISAGTEKPIRVDVNMSSEVGLFQVEEVLMNKVAGSSAKELIQLHAWVLNETERRYL